MRNTSNQGDSLALQLLGLFVFTVAVGLITLSLAIINSNPSRPPFCMEIPEDINKVAEPGVYQFSVETAIHNCGSRSWKQGEYRLEFWTGSPALFPTPLNVPKTNGGKAAEMQLPVTIPITVPVGTMLYVEYQVVGPEGPLGKKFRLTITTQ